jgi:hypothetical protein
VSHQNHHKSNHLINVDFSLADMFGGGKGKAQTPAKKARASTPPPKNYAGMASSSPGGDSDAPQPSKAPARRTLNGITALKYIPFSMTEFQDSLTDSQRSLLQLECETLGKSWFVFFYPSLHCSSNQHDLPGSKSSRTNLKSRLSSS